MKRRSFLKSLFAVALAPIAVLNIFSRPAPGKPGPIVDIRTFENHDPAKTVTMSVRRDYGDPLIWSTSTENLQAALNEMRLDNRRKLKELFTN